MTEVSDNVAGWILELTGRRNSLERKLFIPAGPKAETSAVKKRSPSPKRQKALERELEWVHEPRKADKPKERRASLPMKTGSGRKKKRNWNCTFHRVLAWQQSVIEARRSESYGDKLL